MARVPSVRNLVRFLTDPRGAASLRALCLRAPPPPHRSESGWGPTSRCFRHRTRRHIESMAELRVDGTLVVTEWRRAIAVDERAHQSFRGSPDAQDQRSAWSQA